MKHWQLWSLLLVYKITGSFSIPLSNSKAANQAGIPATVPTVEGPSTGMGNSNNAGSKCNSTSAGLGIAEGSGISRGTSESDRQGFTSLLEEKPENSGSPEEDRGSARTQNSIGQCRPCPGAPKLDKHTIKTTENTKLSNAMEPVSGNQPPQSPSTADQNTSASPVSFDNRTKPGTTSPSKDNGLSKSPSSAPQSPGVKCLPCPCVDKTKGPKLENKWTSQLPQGSIGQPNQISPSPVRGVSANKAATVTGGMGGKAGSDGRPEQSARPEGTAGPQVLLNPPKSSSSTSPNEENPAGATNSNSERGGEGTSQGQIESSALAGSPGPAGSPRPEGSAGSTGSPRPEGSPALAGSPEPAGSPRPEGSTRSAGSPRPEGSPALAGSPGPAGSPRPEGSTGSAGSPRPDGSSALVGSPGSAESPRPEGSPGPALSGSTRLAGSTVPEELVRPEIQSQPQGLPGPGGRPPGSLRLGKGGTGSGGDNQGNVGSVEKTGTTAKQEEGSSNTVPPKSGGGEFVETLDEFQNSALEAHNKYRKFHNAPALTLNKVMSSQATDYAKTLSSLGVDKAEHSQKSSRENEAESIYIACGINPTGAEVTKEWYKELCNYDYTKHSAFISTKSAGHFTQVVWKSTNELGIGRAYGEENTNGDKESNQEGKKDKTECIYVVGRYKPAGNIIGSESTNVERGTMDAEFCGREFASHGFTATGQGRQGLSEGNSQETNVIELSGNVEGRNEGVNTGNRVGNGPQQAGQGGRTGTSAGSSVETSLGASVSQAATGGSNKETSQNKLGTSSETRHEETNQGTSTGMSTRGPAPQATMSGSMQETGQVRPEVMGGSNKGTSHVRPQSTSQSNPEATREGSREANSQGLSTGIQQGQMIPQASAASVEAIGESRVGTSQLRPGVASQSISSVSQEAPNQGGATENARNSPESSQGSSVGSSVGANVGSSTPMNGVSSEHSKDQILAKDLQQTIFENGKRFRGFRTEKLN